MLWNMDHTQQIVAIAAVSDYKILVEESGSLLPLHKQHSLLPTSTPARTEQPCLACLPEAVHDVDSR